MLFYNQKHKSRLSKKYSVDLMFFMMFGQFHFID